MQSLKYHNGHGRKHIKSYFRTYELNVNTIIHFSPEFFICRIHLKQQYVGDKLLAKPDIISKYVETLGCNIAHNKNLYFIVLPKLLSTALE